jgi:3-methyladenine DNA glycosylase AlkD
LAEDLIGRIRSDLQDAADEKYAATCLRFFKEEVKCYGAKTDTVSKIARTYYPEIKSLGKKDIFLLCEELLKSDFNEEAFIAFDWAFRSQTRFEKEDFYVFEGWLNNYVNNWAKCDTLCNHTIGSMVEKFPQLLEYLKLWAKSDNRWFRRASAVTLIIPAKKGHFLKDIFEIADLLLIDKDDLVQKGYGWLLKEASRQHQNEVFKYIMQNKTAMPRTALRYAIEKMPESLKREAMAKI